MGGSAGPNERDGGDAGGIWRLDLESSAVAKDALRNATDRWTGRRRAIRIEQVSRGIDFRVSFVRSASGISTDEENSGIGKEQGIGMIETRESIDASGA